VDIEQQRAARVARVGAVDAPAGKLPDEPRIDGAEREFTALGPFAGAVDVIEQPADLGAGKISVDDEARLLREEWRVAGRSQFVAHGRRPPILPDDGVGDWSAGRTFPDDRGLALVRDTDCGDAVGADVRLGEGLVKNTRLRRPDFGGVMLDPTGVRKDLLKLSLRGGLHVAAAIEQDRPRTGRALVERQDERHRLLLRLLHSWGAA
jgi:hypothetical protein